LWLEFFFLQSQIPNRKYLMFRRRVLLLLILLIACALTPSRAYAHPADMYAQDVSITLASAGVGIDWKILPGPFLADAVWSAADSNHDGSIDSGEAQAWVAPFLSDLTVRLDGQPAGRIQADSIHWPPTVDALRTGEDSVEVALSLNWPSGVRAEHVLDIHNAHLESNTLNWFSLSGSDGLTFTRPAQDNGRLTFDLYFPAVGATHPPASDELVSWTSGTPNLPGFISGSTFASPVASGAAGATNTTAASMLTSLVKNLQTSPLFLLSAFLLSLALGSLHALTPGHGKALVGAYLVGSHGRTRDAMLLGSVVTLTHTGSVLLLGLVTLLASHYILPSLIVPWLELISGVLVVLFGVNLFVQRRREFGQAHVHPHPHEQTPAANVSRHGQNEPGHAGIASIKPLSLQSKSKVLEPWNPRGSTESSLHSVTRKSATVNRKSLLALGISGGLVPCPDAIAILLVAVSLNRVPFGMLLIVAFSVGLAAVLIGIGIAMVHGVRLISGSDWLNRFSRYAPIVSAIVVIVLGAGLTLSAWNTFRFSQAVSAAPVGNVSASRPPALLYIASDTAGNDQIFLLTKPGDTPAQLTRESSGVTGYSISPDGRTILYSVFRLDGGSAIWQIKLDSNRAVMGAPARVLDCPQAECNSPVWYPDGSQVAYERLENTTDSVTIPRFSIWWLNLQTGKTEPVFQDGAFASTAPEFSPDGSWLSYISAASNTLVAYNLQNSRTLSVPLGSQSAIPETWSPKRDILLFGSALPASSTSLVEQVNSAEGLRPLHIQTYSVATGKITDLGGTHGETDYFAAWSPDGQWIAVDRNVPGSDPSASSNQVWLVKPDGTQAHVLLNEAGASYSGLGWSPDGRLLLYSRYKLDYSAGGVGRFDVCSTDITTGEATVLVPGGDIATYIP
jgi:nickel/cobalt transporter (NicO) family protein